MKQVRFIPNVDCGLQVREPQEGQDESRMVVGRPIIFGVRSVNLTPWSETRKVYEILEPGCISEELLQRSDVILNINHSNKVTDVLGRCNNGKGTLNLGLRETYIEAECDLPKTNAANDTLELIRRGDISGMSFAFEDDAKDENSVRYDPTGQIEDGKEVWIRRVRSIKGLFDVSIVTHPAYDQTTVAAREQGEEMMKCIDEQVAAQNREKELEQKREAEEAHEREMREAEERQRIERERKMMDERRRSARRHLNER